MVSPELVTSLVMSCHLSQLWACLWLRLWLRLSFIGQLDGACETMDAWLRACRLSCVSTPTGSLPCCAMLCSVATSLAGVDAAGYCFVGVPAAGGCCCGLQRDPLAVQPSSVVPFAKGFSYQPPSVGWSVWYIHSPSSIKAR